MDKIPFLCDIVDELHYSQELELWIVQLTEHLAKMQRDYPHPHLIVTSSINNEHEVMDRMKDHNRALKHVVETMRLVVAEMGDRRKRLTDKAIGLSDGVVNEEGAQS